MKLYTEEQVMKAYDRGNEDGFNHISISDTYTIFTKPILMPTIDDAIEELRSRKVHHYYRDGFCNGVDWLLKQINERLEKHSQTDDSESNIKKYAKDNKVFEIAKLVRDMQYKGLIRKPEYGLPMRYTIDKTKQQDK